MNISIFAEIKEMIGKGSKLYSIFKMKCPQCHEGDFFTSHPYNLKKVGETHEYCSCCGLKYEKEPGFFYGAMYVSYGLGVALFVTLWVISTWFLAIESSAIQISLIIGVSLILTPYLYALSKIIWINLFISYDRAKSTH